VIKAEDIERFKRDAIVGYCLRVTDGDNEFERCLNLGEHLAQLTPSLANDAMEPEKNGRETG
jgi:hypothetical protein